MTRCRPARRCQGREAAVRMPLLRRTHITNRSLYTPAVYAYPPYSPWVFGPVRVIPPRRRRGQGPLQSARQGQIEGVPCSVAIGQSAMLYGVDT
jgi:hypothetical protein